LKNKYYFILEQYLLKDLAEHEGLKLMRDKRLIKQVLVGCIVAMLALLATACGGGGGGGGNANTPPVSSSNNWDEFNWDEGSWQ